MQRKREAHYRKMDEMLANGGHTLDAKQAEMEATLAKNVQDGAEVLAELHAALDEATEGRPTLPQGQQPEPKIFDSPEEAAAASGPFSPEFRAWRAQRRTSSRGLI
jgi:hypothetical protein